MTPIEIIATVFVIISLIKLVTVIVNGEKWLKVAKHFYDGAGLTQVIIGVLALVVFYFLQQSLSMVEIMAVVAFTTLLIGFELIEYSDDILSIGKKAISDKFSLSTWITLVVWIILLVWTLKELFF